MVRVVQRVLAGYTKPLRFSRLELGTILAIFLGKSQFSGAKPEVMKAGGPTAFSRIAKGVQIVLAFTKPVFKANSELEGTAGELNKVGFWDLQ